MENGSATPDAKASRARKRPKNAPTHVVEFPLVVTEADRHALEKRFRAAGILRNVCTGETLKRLAAMRDDPHWQAARTMPRGAERTETFRDLRTAFGFTKNAMESFARGARDAFWIRDHLGGHDTQTVAAAAFAAAARWSLGLGGEPRFKRIADLRSIASKDATNFMRLKGRPGDGPSSYRFEFRDLVLRLRRRTFSASELHSLSMPALSFRVVRHRDTARERYALQVVVDGPARIHRPRNAGHAGVDIGPSTIAVVTPCGATHGRFCDEVERPWAEIRRAQRAVDRSLRAANPECYRADGTWIRGKRAAKRTKALMRLRAQLRRREAKLARRRRNAHGHLSNEILSAATTIHAERLSLVAFQRAFGRSVGVRAPGLFFDRLRRKAEAVGGGIVSIPTWKAKLSQFDHASGDCVRKPLSLRRHAVRDGSGAVVQRDVYSAFLALHTDSSGVVDVAGCARDWETGACLRLAAASAEADAESARRRRSAPPRGRSRPRSRSPRRSQRPPQGRSNKDRRGGEAPTAVEEGWKKLDGPGPSSFWNSTSFCG